ncbi:MAG: hypothetical protein LUF35_05870 [Lachnospiraceae bacterium]|nr:hypothetical protein [Lachnospiraceae bacterium]
MKKENYLTIGAALLLIAALIGAGIFLAVNYHKDTGASDAAYIQAQKEAEDLLAELEAYQLDQTGAGAGTKTASDNSTAADDDSPDAGSDQVSGTVSDAGEDSIAGNGSDAGYDDPDSDAGYGSDFSSAPETEAEADTEWILEVLALDDTPVIWVGDSRTVGMQKALDVYTEDVYIAASGEGYAWLYETGIVRMETAISQYPGRPVIFNMGVNDYENLYNYMLLYEEVTAGHPDTVFYFLSVNPVDDEAGLYITNAEIEEFNASLAAAYPDTYLDSYTWLAESGAGTIDGIHYSEEVYRSIYLYVKEALSA